MSRHSDHFGYTAVRSEGGMLPYELLEQIGAHSSELGITSTAYYLAEHEPLSEAQSRAWLRLAGLWKRFATARSRLPREDHTVRLTRERWLLPLFHELGYGRLATAKGSPDLIVDGREFPMSHMHTCAPIHLMGAGVDLDRRTPKIAGAIHSSPHGLVQDFLNRSKRHRWGIVSNGLLLRLLRDSHTFTRRPYLEFDLESIFDGELYSDFRLLWLCAHASRLSPAENAPKQPENTPMDHWFQRAKTEGIRVRDRLRNGVQQAIERLGAGFLRHPANVELHRALAVGDLTPQGYYRELMRLIYRLIFVFVAEDRGVLQPPIAAGCEPESARARHQAQQRYVKYYATTNLREMVRRRRGDHYGDRWAALRLVLTKLHRGCTKLDLPAFGSALFSPDTTPHLHDAELTNADLLPALYALCTFIDEGKITRPVSWRHIGADELGSVFESLLEYVPKLHREAATFTLEVAPGNERKTTGSYYTPEPLVECLLDSTLDPVLDRACTEPNAEKALLGLKVCDPACGSGHFLVAAGRRIAHRVAQVRAGDDEPSPHEIRRALRDVHARCIFGVDINPLAVELCKVSLWMEAIEPERTLPFLDGHILQGNSLLGATPALIAGGIPDGAFAPIEGDDKEVATRLRKRNRNERMGKAQGVQRGLFHVAAGLASLVDHGQHRRRAEAFEAMPDDTFAAFEAKRAYYKEHVSSAEARALQLVADTWCAAFVWPKDDAHEASAPTHWLFDRIRESPTSGLTDTVVKVRQLAREYGLFHWHLEYPQVFSVPERGEAERPKLGWNGGFDAVLGNPPWERIKLQEKEFFATRSEAIANARNAAARKKLIAKLPETEPDLWYQWHRALRRATGESQLVRMTGRYPLCGRGDINTYTIFAELDHALSSGHGSAGLIVPSGISTDATAQHYFREIFSNGSLVSIFSFAEIREFFTATDSRDSFSLLTMTGFRIANAAAQFAFGLHGPAEIHGDNTVFVLTAEDLALLNPNTRTCPVFRSLRDAEISKAIYRRVPILLNDDGPNEASWAVRFSRMLDMANDSDQFTLPEELSAQGWTRRLNVFLSDGATMLPLYEAKMVHFFDHRLGTYTGQTEAQAKQGTLPYLTAADHADPALLPFSRYWVSAELVEKKLRGRWAHRWLAGWRDICRNSDFRTLICSVVPWTAVAGKLPLLLPWGPWPGLLLANLSSFIVDYVTRQKVGGTSLSIFIIKQLPILPPTAYDAAAPWHPATALAEWILPRVLELTYTAWDLIGFARDHGYGGPPFRWDEERRFWLRAELDAAYFHLYGLAPDEVDHVMESFRLVRQRDEKVHGNFRTKLAILDLYQRMASAGPKAPYQTALDPPPADPSVAHPPLTKAQAEELAPILERALAAPSPGSGVSAEAISAKRKPKSRAKAHASKPAATTQINLGIHTPAPQTNEPAAANRRPTVSVAGNAPSTAPLVDPPSIQHLIALEDPSITLEMLAVLRVLHGTGEAQSKAQLVEATELETKICTATLATLLDTGMLEQQGRGRGTKYQLVK